LESDWLFPVGDVAAKLPDDTATMRFHYALRHGSMKLGLYAPPAVDTQGPHKQDEIYIIIAGTGDFVKNQERRPFGPNDAIFVEAGAEHRFENFAPGFSAWVIFWGPEGGEADAHVAG
jgi:mannose-6-phosphate isomerase-like protein (cupin superfamily)